MSETHEEKFERISRMRAHCEQVLQELERRRLAQAARLRRAQLEGKGATPPA